MQLTLWTYEGPAHVGAMRVATAMRHVHYVLHAPQGDTYADLLFTMIERSATRPPVTYTTFQARDLGGDTAELFRTSARDAVERFRPELLLVGASCTGELIQDDPAGLSRGLGVETIALELPSYQRKENWAASETFYQVVRRCAAGQRTPRDGRAPSCNLLGATALGFRHRDDVREITALLERIGVAVNVCAPLGAAPSDLARLGAADFNVVLYPETAGVAARWLEREFRQPHTRTVPIGVGATREFVAEVAALAGLDPAQAAADAERHSNLPWYSRSVDATYLTGKRVFVFGDATHAVAAARVAAKELGFAVVGLGTYSREFARELREAAALYGVTPLVCDDYLDVEAAIAAAAPDLVLGTQMERHIAKRLGIPCAVISSPVHVQDFPARHSPQMGFEGANVLFDTWVHPLMMGLEEHLLAMFREDPEFGEGAAPSHLGHAHVPRPTPHEAATVAALAADALAVTGSREAGKVEAPPQAPPKAAPAERIPREAGSRGGFAPGGSGQSPALLADEPAPPAWHADAERELRRVPVFVRGKARRNTEAFARERGIATISVATLYDAKAHHAR